MKQGDLVRLKQPFQPEPEQPQSYSFGLIAAFAQVKGNGQSHSEACLLLYLYEPDRATPYTDELGSPALFTFQPHEVELS